MGRTRYNQLAGTSRIVAAYPENAPIPPSGSVNIYRNLSDQELYTVTPDGIHTKIGGGGDIWLDAGSFTYDQWQPNATNTGSIPLGVTVPPGKVMTGIMMKLTSQFLVGFPTIAITEPNAQGSGFANPIGMGGPTGVGRTATQLVEADFNGDVSTSRVFQIDMTLAVGTIDGMNSGEFQIWYKLGTLE